MVCTCMQHVQSSSFCLFILLLSYNNLLQTCYKREMTVAITAVEVTNYKGKVKQSIIEGSNL